MSHNYQQELEVGLAAVRTASKICQSVQSGITPAALEKKDRSPVTIADFASQAVVCREIRTAFSDPIIGEEGSAELRADDGAEFLQRVVAEVTGSGIDASGEQICDWIDEGSAKDYSDRFWTLDPIDGTKGFLRGEQYAVALALVVNGKVDVGLVACPNLADVGGEQGTICVAVRGQGAWTVPLSGGDSTPAKVTTTTDSSTARFCESVESGHSSHGHSAQIAEILGMTADSVRLDSQAKYAVVGRGEADIYLRLPTRPGYREKIWDHAGGVLFCEEAGATVTDIAGKPLEFTHGFELVANRGVVVTNGPLHEAVLAAVKQVGIE
jgi:3'(2'), 5'-bisphosphate nucleotidase